GDPGARLESSTRPGPGCAGQFPSTRQIAGEADSGAAPGMRARVGGAAERDARSPPALPPAGAVEGAAPGGVESGLRPRDGRAGVGILPGAMETGRSLAVSLECDVAPLWFWE